MVKSKEIYQFLMVEISFWIFYFWRVKSFKVKSLFLVS